MPTLLRLLAFFIVALCGGAQISAADNVARPSAQTVRQWQNHKYGMFIHFGLYSELGGVWKGKQSSGNYSEQIQSDAHIPEAEYAQLASEFNPEHWDAERIVRLAQDAGMRFIVITAKHHDGFSLFGTKASPFNVVDASPYAKDIVKDLADACARHGLAFGVYYSTIDWHFGDVPDPMNDNPISPAHEKFNLEQIRELVTGYGRLSEVWFDMGHPTKLQSKHFADQVHKYQPECMVSGRVWNSEGDFLEMGDDEIPDYILDEPWESPASIFQDTWGYRSWQARTGLQQKIQEHIKRLVAVVSRGGNYILNIGPKGDGSLVSYEADVLRGTGEWLKRNGEAIYATQPQPFRKLDFGYATVSGNKLYLFVEHTPADGQLRLPGLKTVIRSAYLLGDPSRSPLAVNRDDGKGQSVAAPKCDCFMPVVSLEMAGDITVEEPLTATDTKGTITLLSERADHFYNNNGEGYYDPPTLRKLRWSFAVVRGGTYQIELTYRPGSFSRRVDVLIEGQVLRASVQGDRKVPVVIYTVPLKTASLATLTVEPGAPRERGAPLGFEPTAIKLTRIGE
jgi:alpha-L-fucosidase